MKAKRTGLIVAMCAPLLHFTIFGLVCSPNDALKYFSQNACDFVNCDVLFFVEDMFPLSQRPTMSGGVASSGSIEVGAEEEEGGGHMH